MSLAWAGCGMDVGGGADQVSLRMATPAAESLPAAARTAVAEALAGREQESAVWSVISLRWEETWALATLTPVDLDAPLLDHEESHLDLDQLYALLLVHTEKGWQAALEGDERVYELLARVPLPALSEEARAAMFPRKGEVVAMAYNGYKFFWPAGPAWRVTQGWHDTYTWGNRYPSNHSLDFDITGTDNSDILAGAPGTVTHMCNDGIQVLVGVTTAGTTERLGYLHLDSATVAAQGIVQGSVVSTGTKLGRMVSGALSTTCGYSTGTHLHMYLPYKPITIDGVTFTSTNVNSGVNLYSSQGGCSTASLSVPTDRWRVSIWNNRYFSGSAVDIRYEYPGDKGFNVNWGNGGPASCVGTDNFSVRYRRDAYFATSGYYEFTTTADDGVRVYVDGGLIIDRWIDQGPTTYTAQVWVNAGWHAVRLDYYENGGGATVSLDWYASGSGNPYPSCPCNRSDNYCQHGPSTSGCPMTYPYGYCDPNGDGSYSDGDWTRGWYEYQDYCL